MVKINNLNNGYWVKNHKKVGIWVWVLGIIPKKSGIWVWVWVLGIMWVSYSIPNTYKKSRY
jgi:hypothetical protein